MRKCTASAIRWDACVGHDSRPMCRLHRAKAVANLHWYRAGLELHQGSDGLKRTERKWRDVPHDLCGFYEAMYCFITVTLPRLHRFTSTATSYINVCTGPAKKPVHAQGLTDHEIYMSVGGPVKFGKMSAPTPNAEIISAYQQNLVYNHSVNAALTVACYEFLATFRHEYELVWKRRWTGATWLFLANRYLTLANIIVLISPYSSEVRYAAAVVELADPHIGLRLLESLPTIILAVFSTLRVFALLGRAYIPAAFTFALGVAPLVLGFYQSSQVTYYYVDDPVLGSSCYYNYLMSPSVLFYSKNCSEHITMTLTHLTVTLAATLSTIVADVIAITITWIKTYRHVREASSIGADAGFGAALLRYGSMFFIVLFIMNLTDGLVMLAVCLVFCHNSQHRTDIVVYGFYPIPHNTEAAPSPRLPNIILSRFLINLRQINVPESGSAARFSHFSLPNFRMPSIPSIIGNLGEPLADNEDDRDDEDHVAAEAYAERAGAAVSAGEDVGTSEVMDIGTLETEEDPVESV
ncbi:hypothetical protein NM688_g8225 [Phlebia brevispora]|uniref:Uncharacterized protein n=1 Tax=Phlebia brevispora TaxID=194682 RepID=A0ACC1RVP9_9APHY|nr:hypothetical protein NM688_g8225 [Phlebia brevispora]